MLLRCFQKFDFIKIFNLNLLKLYFKAGIVCKLKTQCSVLAACNPKGTYDSEQPITVNIAISSPLLSRFDVVLLLMDSPNEDWDTLASTFLLQGKDLLVKEKINKTWSFEQLRLYINYVKKFMPLLTPEANIVIQKYYQLQRQSGDRNAARTTVRMLESVIRLSQGKLDYYITFLFEFCW